MSNQYSQPYQFTPYTPQVNSELYGQMLQKKELDYQKGIQRVDAVRDTIASLPIARPADRQYVQQKLDTMTSELNRDLGADWSNMGIQRLASKHISSIGDDPEVVKAVYNTALYQKDYNRYKEDETRTKGMNIANRDAFEEDSHKWLNSEGVGLGYTGTYVNYRDINKEANDFLSKLHPDLIEKVKVGEGKDIWSGWEKAIRSFKGIDRQKLQTALDEFINTTPGIKDQMNVNARYEYKNYDIRNYENRMRTVSDNWNAVYLKTILDMEQGKLNTTDPAKIKEIDDSIKDIRTKKIPEVWENYEKSVLSFQDPEYRRNAINDLYERNWKLGILTLNSGGNEYKEDYGGMSPRETYFRRSQEKRENAKFAHDIEQDKIKNQQEERKIAIQEGKDTKGNKVVSLKAVDNRGLPVSDYIAAQQKTDQLNNSLTDSKVSLLSALANQKGNNVMSDFFTEDNATGKPMIKGDKMVPLTDIGAQYLHNPSVGQFKNPVYGKDYVNAYDYLMGFTDAKGRYNNGVIDDLIAGQSAGGVDAAGLPMPFRQSLAEMRSQIADAKARDNAISAINEKWNSKLSSDLKLKAYHQKVTPYFQSTAVIDEDNGNKIPISGYQLNQFYDLYIKAKDEPTVGLGEVGVSPYDNMIQTLTEQTGYNEGTVRALVKHFKPVDDTYKELHDQEMAFKDNLAKSMNMVPVIKGIPLTDGKLETFKDVAGDVTLAMNYVDGDANTYDEIRKKLNKGSEGDASIKIVTGYNELNPDAPFFYAVSGKDGISEYIYMTEQQANEVGLPVDKIHQPESPITTKLNLNRVAYKGGYSSTVPYGKGNDWENAETLTFDNNEEYRYTVTQASPSAPLWLYKYRRTNKGVEPAVTQKFSSASEIEKYLDNLRRTIENARNKR